MARPLPAKLAAEFEAIELAANLDAGPPRGPAATTPNPGTDAYDAAVAARLFDSELRRVTPGDWPWP